MKDEPTHHEQMGGWVDGWMDGWMDGWTCACSSVRAVSHGHHGVQMSSTANQSHLCQGPPDGLEPMAPIWRGFFHPSRKNGAHAPPKPPCAFWLKPRAREFGDYGKNIERFPRIDALCSELSRGLKNWSDV